MVRHAFEVLSFGILLDLIVGVGSSFRPKLSLAHFSFLYFTTTRLRHVTWDGGRAAASS